MVDRCYHQLRKFIFIFSIGNQKPIAHRRGAVRLERSVVTSP